MTAGPITAAAAEYAVLARYDYVRTLAGHDYGSGQRGAELMRRRRELALVEQLSGTNRLVDYVTDYRGGDLRVAQAIVDAFERVGRPRIVRAHAETFRRGTPATRRTIDAWERVQNDVALLGALIARGNRAATSSFPAGPPRLDDYPSATHYRTARNEYDVELELEARA